MSSDNSAPHTPQQFRLLYNVTGPLAAFVLLQLFDGNGKLIAKGYERLSIQLPKGLYQLHIFSNEKLEQQLIRLDKDYEASWQNSGTYSSIPSSFLKSSHEYYTETARQWSIEPTVQKEDHTLHDSALFLFFRYPDRNVKEEQEQVAQSMGWRFCLLNKDREIIHRLQGDAIREDNEMGWLAFHVKLSPGIYYLVYNGPRKKEIPLYAFDNWQTQFFLTFKRTPIFQTARTQLVRIGNSFEITEQDNLELDTLLHNMQNGLYYVPHSLIEKTASAKWENPMLAIVVCYAYLLGTDKADDNLFRIMIRNLQNRILRSENAPDIKAIRLLAALHFKEPIPALALEEPCMLTAGMKAFIEQSAMHPHAITISKYCEAIIYALQGDTVWTSYTPLDYDIKKDHKEQAAREKAFEDNWLKGIDYTFSYKTEQKTTSPALPNDWLSQSIMQQLSTEKTSAYTVTDLALQFQVSGSLVQDRVQQIDQMLEDNPNLLTTGSATRDKELNLPFIKMQIQNMKNKE